MTTPDHDPEVGTVWEMNGKTYIVTMSVYYPEISEWYVRMNERKRDKSGRLRRLPGIGANNHTSGYFNAFREKATFVSKP